MSKLLTLNQFSTSMNSFADKCDARFMKKGEGANYTIKAQATAESGYFATYQLWEQVDDDPTNDVAVGAKINIPKDYLVTAVSQTPLTVTAADKEEGGIFYNNTDFAVGDKYIRFTVNVKDAAQVSDTYMYINLNSLVDEYHGSNAIELNSSTNTFSLKLDTTNANGLEVTSSGLKLNAVSASTSGTGGSNGAMTAAQAEKLAGLENTTAGNGIDITNHVASVVVDSSNARGLSVGANGVALAAATPDTYSGSTKTSDGTAGAMTSADKYKLDSMIEATDQEVAAVIAAIWAS